MATRREGFSSVRCSVCHVAGHNATRHKDEVRVPRPRTSDVEVRGGAAIPGIAEGERMTFTYETSEWGISVLKDGEEVGLFETMDEAQEYVRRQQENV